MNELAGIDCTAARLLCRFESIPLETEEFFGLIVSYPFYIQENCDLKCEVSVNYFILLKNSSTELYFCVVYVSLSPFLHRFLTCGTRICKLHAFNNKN